MTHLDTVAFTSWSVLTAVCMISIGLIYRRFTRTGKNETRPS
ncbi:protein of unknown function [Candidatus Nitrosotalea okcheonensis]|uniref:Uncharacterized protein n=1 Tax=Candidatus Nitrosotalea okcheonensis TaxID=1903276 RepID=A0A2H1FDA6_9ARCH|nr:protein of unknown function [Candidatus Nitrosotalea okcheonensis]